MWSARNPFYLSATRFMIRQQRRRGEERGKKKKPCKSRPGVAGMNTAGEFLRQRRSRGATRVLYLLTAETRESGTLSRFVWREICFLTLACAPLNLRSKNALRGWGEVCYLCNCELKRVWSWSSESWTWISIFSPHRVRCTPPNTSWESWKARNGWMSEADPRAFEQN